ncbi:hypothetical protein AQ505_15040 [Pedobacter sp. PACM 27299]|uniref:DUF6929 family protein n=1 Tax=Pedobacter sp. PACM 27299 TaxID=1727164 RepID=UPI0007067E78|nr:hypothetical protein [Pedobacter sp. PACM 27299]ALL06695.1 hypothetical protein AQ505_15040 [Pedobacter sp. PACM 27299]
MYKFTLELLFQIIGIGSASGLVLKNDQLNVISDYSTFLYSYELKSAHLTRHPLSTGPSQNITKKTKPDFEAITSYGDQLYIFGSGSTENRSQMVSVNAKSKQVISTRDVADVYQEMRRVSGLNSENFNLEGVVFTGKEWYFLNRGNGGAGRNGVFVISGEKPTATSKITFKEILLPGIKGVATGFTDAILVDHHIYFLAAAEDSQSTYQDGVVFGTLIGSINIAQMELDFTEQISDRHKFEGLALKHQTADEMTFLLCEDNDTDKLQADIYQLKLKR